MQPSFKRWVGEHYPQHMDSCETYEKIHREWMPWKRCALQMASLIVGVLLVAIPSMIYYATIPSESWWQPVFGIFAVIMVAAITVLCMIIADTIYDKRSAKPTPPRPSRRISTAHREDYLHSNPDG